MASVLEKAGAFDPRRLFGVTTLDVVRAARFLGGISGADPKDTVIPVVGGHSGVTIVPLLSQSSYGQNVKGEALDKIVYRIQYGGDEVVKAKDGAGSATLSMAYAGAKFTNALLRGLNGEKGVITPSFVKSDLYASQGIDFFSSLVELGVCIITIPENFDIDINLFFSSRMVLKRFTPWAKSPPKSRSYSRRRYLNSKRTSRRARLLLPNPHKLINSETSFNLIIKILSCRAKICAGGMCI